MKTTLIALILGAITVQQDGCDLIKKYTGKEWSELSDFTRFMMIFAGIWGLAIIIAIIEFLMYDREDGQP